MSKDFTFKRFHIQQENAAFKVGTDSVVLGAWAQLKNAKTILDIGTGTGLLALMCAQRNEMAQITAIEKDQLSALDAGANFKASVWNARLSVLQVSLEEFTSETKFDYIICNPPYFYDALPSLDARKNEARHIADGWFNLLSHKIDELCTESGLFGCILPEKEFELLSDHLYTHYWHLTRTQRLCPYPGGEKTRVLAEWKKEAWINRNFPNLYVRNTDGEYSADYKKLTQDFYLKF